MVDLLSQFDSFFQNREPSETSMVLCVVHDEKRILLGLKKRGIGTGLWVAFGGHVDAGESIVDAAKRELEEESGLIWQEGKYCGAITIWYEEWRQSLLVHVFDVYQVGGVTQESIEMLPRWFLKDDIPFDSMWPDDRHWMPLLFEGMCFAVDVRYTRQNVLAPDITVQKVQYKDLPGVSPDATLLKSLSNS